MFPRPLSLYPEVRRPAVDLRHKDHQGPSGFHTTNVLMPAADSLRRAGKPMDDDNSKTPSQQDARSEKMAPN